MSENERQGGIATPDAWRAGSRAARQTRAERLRLPSGATVLAARPEPLEWIFSGRVPQRLLGAALSQEGRSGASEDALSREEVLELARFAVQLIRASVLEPAIGEGPGEMRMEEIPVEDRVFIFEWACRALSRPAGGEASPSSEEDLASEKLARFREE
jgi:hypothetical protein